MVGSPAESDLRADLDCSSVGYERIVAGDAVVFVVDEPITPLELATAC